MTFSLPSVICISSTTYPPTQLSMWASLFTSILSPLLLLLLLLHHLPLGGLGDTRVRRFSAPGCEGPEGVLLTTPGVLTLQGASTVMCARACVDMQPLCTAFDIKSGKGTYIPISGTKHVRCS
jgi:hypothetical protein